MRSIFKKLISLSTLVCLFLSSEFSSGQTYRFRNYGTENNLPGEVVYSLNQDSNGYLWVGTSEGLSRFDGFEFFKVQFPDSSEGRYATASMKDRQGVLWFGCNDGTLFHTEGRELVQFSLPDASGTGVSSILEGPDGNIYVISQRKPIFKIDPLKKDKVTVIRLQADPGMFSAAFYDSGEMLIGTQENLIICNIKGDSLKVINSIGDFDYSRITAIQRIGNSSGYIIGTDWNGIFQLQKNEDHEIIKRFDGFPGLDNLPVKSITGDSLNNIWISTNGNGVVRLHFDERYESPVSVHYLKKESGLAGENVNTVFRDNEENIWIGFNGEGLSVMTTDAFEFLIPGVKNQPKSIIFIGRLENNYILGTSAGFYTYDLTAGKSVSFTKLPENVTRLEAASYYADNDGNIWIGTKGSGLWLKRKSGQIMRFYKSGDTGADYINSIKVYGDNIWLASLNGLHIVSRQTGRLISKYDMNNGLPHNSINQIILDDEGKCYVATESDKIYKVDIESGVAACEATMYGVLLNKVLDLDMDSNGSFWAATSGNGVFECSGDSVKLISSANGLMSNYCYSILADREDNIWIGHERGISRYNPDNEIVKVYPTDFANGGSCNSTGIYESIDGKIFFGTSEGLIIYDRSKDLTRHEPPVNVINSVTINDNDYPLQSSYTLPYHKRYNIKISFAGINLRDPEKVYYSTYLENYDDDWTEASLSREVTYNLSDGRYKFNLLSVNEDGLTQEEPLSFEISIKQPFWRAWWFFLSVIAAVAGVFFIILRQREKAQKKIQEYLEKELEARTKVVVQQKAKLEIQNLEITDSINYAKRIQSSILPDIKKLRENFRDAFVILYPRDIVSGDFYWFDRLDDDRIVLVCADSTGHGVPGAFMSMIGTTLLQDIVSRQGISKPSEVLTILDKQIFSILNQNLELGVSNDGMDIVVCEFTLKNRHVRFASAMRPVMLVMGGEMYYIKGNRASVGGQTVLEKYFDDQEYYLNEGDTIYLFSDGLPDQFGGPEGKKMKIARLKDLVGELTSLPLDKQEEEMVRFYKEWKGDFEQVDDILFMGVRV
jgi:ligand-binding sensor domain-containing protein/serine phosphatase RsbU (regulator of sigma subunit)